MAHSAERHRLHKNTQLFTLALTSGAGILFVLLYAYYKKQGYARIRGIVNSIKRFFSWQSGLGMDGSNHSRHTHLGDIVRTEYTEPVFEVGVSKSSSYSVCVALNGQSNSILEFYKELHSTTLKSLTLYPIAKVESDEEERIYKEELESFFKDVPNHERILKRQLYCSTERGIIAMVRQIVPRFIIVSSDFSDILKEVPRLMKKTQFIVIPSGKMSVRRSMNVGKQIIYAEGLADVLPIITSF